MWRLISGHVVTRILKKRLVATVDGDEEIFPEEKSNFSSERQKVIGVRWGLVIKAAHDHEQRIADFFDLGKMFGIQAVLHRGSVQLESIGDAAQDFGRGITQIPPMRYRLVNGIEAFQRFLSSNAAKRTPAMSMRSFIAAETL